MIRFLAIFLFIFSIANAKNSDLIKIQDSLNSIKTMEAKIIQIDSKNDNLKGMFYLSKPGKMRIEYKAKKSDILIVASKQMVTYYDKELDEVSHIPTNSTPATLLMQENINFDDFIVLDFEEKNNIYLVTFYRKEAKDDGIFTFSFKKDDGNFILQRIDKYSDESKKSRISILFTQVKINHEINDKLFIIKDKRL